MCEHLVTELRSLRLLNASWLIEIYHIFRGGWRAATSLSVYPYVTYCTPLITWSWILLFYSRVLLLFDILPLLDKQVFPTTRQPIKQATDVLKKRVPCAVMAGGSKMKRVKPHEAVSGSSLFLICTHGWLSRWEWPTPCSTLVLSRLLFSFHSLHSSPHLAFLFCSLPPLSSTPLPPQILYVPLYSHNRPPQGSTLLLSESDSFSATLSFLPPSFPPHSLQEGVLPFNNCGLLLCHLLPGLLSFILQFFPLSLSTCSLPILRSQPCLTLSSCILHMTLAELWAQRDTRIVIHLLLPHTSPQISVLWASPDCMQSIGIWDHVHAFRWHHAIY